MNLQSKTVYDYFSFALTTKVRSKLIHMRSLIDQLGTEQPKESLNCFLASCINESGASLDDVVACYKKHFTEEAEVSVQRVELEDEAVEEEEASNAEIIFDDEGHALETVGLPTEREELEDERKKDILKAIYSNEEVVSFLGLTETSKECNKEYTKEELLDYIFNEEAE